MTNFNSTFQWYILHIFFRMAVPFFFTASGFLFGKKYINNRKNLKEVSRKQIKRLLIPFVFWMLVGLPYIIYTLQDNDGITIVLEIVKKAIFYPWGALWYILALIVAIFIEYWVLKRGKLSIAILVGVFLYFICLLGNSYYFLIDSTPIKSIVDTYMSIFISTRNGIFEAFPMFTMGVYLAYKENKIERMKASKLIISFIIVLLIQVCEITFIRNRNYIDDHSLFFTTIPISCLLLIFCIKCKKIEFKRINTQILRNLSTSIYFMHYPIIWTLSFFNIYMKNWETLIFTVIISIIISLILYKINNKYINYIIK